MKKVKSFKKRGFPPKYKGSRRSRTTRERNKDSLTWSDGFLMAVAMKEALKAQKLIDRGVY